MYPRLTALISLVAVFTPRLMAQTPSLANPSNLAMTQKYCVQNHGQWPDPSIQFGFISDGLGIAFRQSSIDIRRLNLNTDSALTANHALADNLICRVSFPGSNTVEAVGAEPQRARFNYFVDPEHTASNVPSFGAIIYPSLYDGIDLIAKPTQRGLIKYEFHLQPGSDYSKIMLHLDQVDSLCVDDAGDLHIRTPIGTLVDAAPIVRQANSQLRARFQIIDSCTFTVVLLDQPDPFQPFVIDPDVKWMDYLGGGDEEEAHGVTTDSNGAVYVTGFTLSTDFAGAGNSNAGSADAFVLKSDATGEMEWMTYLGGRSGDTGEAIAVDANGVLLTGSTRSDDFTVHMNSRHGDVDAFVCRVGPSGQPIWTTYVGGRSAEVGRSIVLDKLGNAYIAGETNSNDFEGRNNETHGLTEGFIASVDASGIVQWMTYLGGSGHDYLTSVVFDGPDSFDATGYTASQDFEGANNSNAGNFDTCITHVSTSGVLQWMTYLGGRRGDEAYGIAIDPAGHIYIAGMTESTDFVGANNVHHGGIRDVFVTKTDAAGHVDWTTYLGGGATEYGYGLALDADGAAYVTGYSYSSNFVGRKNSFHGGMSDAFTLKVAPTGDLDWLLFHGGHEGEVGYGITIADSGEIIVAGLTDSEDFDGRLNSFHGGALDAFVLHVQPPVDAPNLDVTTSCPNSGPIHITWSGATPRGQAALIFARTTGSYVLQTHACHGTQLGLGPNQIQIVFLGRSGPDGSHQIDAQAASGVCGGRLQLLDLTTCATSNVVRLE